MKVSIKSNYSLSFSALTPILFCIINISLFPKSHPFSFSPFTPKMSDVPSDLFREILLRLPAESVFRLRSVCKKWQRMIDDPSFIKAHTSNQLYNHPLLVQNQTGPLHSFSLDSLNFISGPQVVDARFIKDLNRIDLACLSNLFYVALCNGLILLSSEKNVHIWAWAIWNPLTGEYREMPREMPQLNGTLDLTGFGFWYDGVADDYKVVRIDRSVSSGETVFQTLVYSLKSGSWSTIKGGSQNCPLLKFKPGVFLNGTLYWISSEGILALDLTTESYFQLSLPPTTKIGGGFCLSALDGCLLLSVPQCYDVWHFDGWVMKDNGVEKSWKELFSQPCSVFGSLPFNMELVAYLKSKRQVVVHHLRGYLLFDLESNSVKKFSIHGFPNIISSRICPGSLVPLGVRDSAIELGAVAESSARKSMKTNARLKFCVRDVGEKCCSDNGSCSEVMCRLCKLN